MMKIRSRDLGFWRLFWVGVKLAIVAFVVIGLRRSPGGAPLLRAADCSTQSVGFVPLVDLGRGMYQGFQGGLYPNGLNTRPVTHEQAGLSLAQAIKPLGVDGLPDPKNGVIVLLSVGMSNATQEFSTFIDLAAKDPHINPKLTLVDGAQSSWSANKVVDPNVQYWKNIEYRLSRQGLTPQQVQIVWLKETDAHPSLPFPADAQKLQQELKTIVQIIKQQFSNVKMVYLSSRIYAGYATADLSPEPYAYQSGFAVKWLIEAQINNEPDLNFNPKTGEVKAPWLSWGPYLWADGLTPRGDGLTWGCHDLGPDGTHPAEQGRLKVATLLLDFFKSDPTASPWFLNGSAAFTSKQ